MRIELSKTPNWLKITWSFLDTNIEAEILRRLATVGALGEGRRWFAPVSEVYRCMDIFPKASFAYEAMCAADELTNPKAQPPARPEVDTSEFGPLFRGIQNAKKREEKQAQYGKRRQGKRKVEL